MIQLKPIDESNYQKILAMELPCGQHGFIASHAISLAQRRQPDGAAAVHGDSPCGRRRLPHRPLFP